ncbi:hypothetical protein BDV27DRAFT_106622 [Aspergillus caelatus]|uniref:Uncharacterized protein n=1 Tax=Aspergillus caelatus TaxID=61420 RepID=A0A5N7A6H7_9EURO|nr:uncharacterized protein BDV27DRAFT_106622 [Aspergillus caelatus]KAE8365213.1 hypothetical protein BDV27DRAFT_106622 [Aspergillus caelatus]
MNPMRQEHSIEHSRKCHHPHHGIHHPVIPQPLSFFDDRVGVWEATYTRTKRCCHGGSRLMFPTNRRHLMGNPSVHRKLVLNHAKTGPCGFSLDSGMSSCSRCSWTIRRLIRSLISVPQPSVLPFKSLPLIPNTRLSLRSMKATPEDVTQTTSQLLL